MVLDVVVGSSQNEEVSRACGTPGTGIQYAVGMSRPAERVLNLWEAGRSEWNRSRSPIH